jgi:hypothetical protein
VPNSCSQILSSSFCAALIISASLSKFTGFPSKMDHLCFRQPRRRALSGHEHQPPAPGRLRLQDQREAQSDLSGRFRASLSTPYNAYEAWGIGSGCVYDHTNCRSRQHCVFAAIYSSNPGGSGMGIRAAAIVRRFRRN